MQSFRLPALFVSLVLLLPAPPPADAAPSLSEAARWLQEYVRIDTTTPQGEKRAAVYLAGILRREGIEPRLIPNPQGRPSLLARLSSPRSGGRAVVLLHHMDVVPPGEGWTVPPFSGQVRDGLLWGRGAVDVKSLGIAQLAAMVDLKRKRVPLERDVIYLAVPDEENGGLQGAGWLLARHPELFRGVEAVMGEGGRAQTGAGDDLLWWGIEVVQKRPLWLEISATGRGGHGSGLNPHSAPHRLIEGLARVLALPPRWRVTPPGRAYCRAIAPLHEGHWRRVLSDIDRVIGETGPKELLMPTVSNLFVDTLQVTVLQGASKINVIPARAKARVDVRLLPDTDAEAFLARIRQALGQGFQVKVLVTSPPVPESPAGGRFYQAVERTLRADGPVVPTFIPGFTDSRFFRARGIPAYGVSPFVIASDHLRGVHGPDERIPLAALDRGVERTRRMVRLYAASPAR
ncbi:MAG TPA: M20/M25/M40 family metallo-hydrolase [Thermoanaerobaculia bacterium]|nr:M20/M25/M40 family metallo-hydrolase [Thermoanaerobaculia bacterium]